MEGFTGGKSYIYRKRRAAKIMLALALISVCAAVAACMVGSSRLSLSDIITACRDRISGQPPTSKSADLIVFSIRLPRILLSYLAGAALSVSGAGMQGIFRNPMADPYLMGVSSGASLGAAAAMILGLQMSFLGMGAISISAFIGAGLAMLVVLALSGRRAGGITLLLSGVAVGAFLSAALSGLLALNRESAESVYLWTMGSFSAASWPKVAMAAPVITAGCAAMCVFARDLNAMLTGEEGARTLGIPVARVRLVVILISTLITSTAVSMCGVIGFVGLMVPHAVRLISGPDHRSLLPISALSGGLFLLIMDTVARSVASVEIPVGVLTALIGGPFFLVMLRRRRNVAS